MSYTNPDREYQICTRCIMDTSIPEIRFDEQGVCQFCHIHDILESKYPLDENQGQRRNELAKRIKAAGKNKEFDCVCGCLLYTSDAADE